MKEKIKDVMQDASKSENILNIPNLLTLLRFLGTFVVIYLIAANFQRGYTAVFFILFAITDFLDGQIARIFEQKTEFGRKFDVIADRLFFGGVALSLFLFELIFLKASRIYILQFFLVMSREIITIPVFFMANIKLPQVRFIGKITTLLQGITLAMLMLYWNASLYFAIITFIVGIVSGIYYIRDALTLNNKK